jgi:hypothetical protein
MMEIVSKMDEWGKPAWITAMILGFVIFWPIGLGILFYLIWSGRMGCKSSKFGKWHNVEDKARNFWGANPPSSGNMAFDEYRAETLKRLEDEQKEFKDFLDRLRHAKDKAEFDQFMADRKANPEPKPKNKDNNNGENGSVPATA